MLASPSSGSQITKCRSGFTLVSRSRPFKVLPWLTHRFTPPLHQAIGPHVVINSPAHDFVFNFSTRRVTWVDLVSSATRTHCSYDAHPRRISLQRYGIMPRRANRHLVDFGSRVVSVRSKKYRDSVPNMLKQLPLSSHPPAIGSDIQPLRLSMGYRDMGTLFPCSNFPRGVLLDHAVYGAT